MDNAQSVDWGGVWNQQMELSARKWGGENAWYERASLPPVGIETSNYVDEIMARMELRTEDSVLDIGCGNGAISVAIAKRVQRVTALDSDPRMLPAVTRSAMGASLTNVRFVHARWDEMEMGREVEEHDVVLASRSLPMGDLSRSLERMNRAAKRLGYLTWIVGEKAEGASISRILGTEYYPLPEYGIIYNMLYAMGLHPKVEIFESRGSQIFKNLEDAVHDLTRGYQSEIEATKKQAEVESWVASQLHKDNGQLRRDVTTKWALIWWRKV